MRARLGYDWVPMRADGTDAETREQRVWQQIEGGWHPQTGPLLIDARLRIDYPANDAAVSDNNAYLWGVDGLLRARSPARPLVALVIRRGARARPAPNA